MYRRWTCVKTCKISLCINSKLQCKTTLATKCVTSMSQAIAGLSMGGYGAIKYGLKYPSVFAFAGSMSGAFGVTRYTDKEMGGANWEPFLKSQGPVDSETRKANDVFEIARGLSTARIASLPYFYLDCGTEDAGQHFNAN